MLEPSLHKILTPCQGKMEGRLNENLNMIDISFVLPRGKGGKGNWVSCMAKYLRDCSMGN